MDPVKLDEVRKKRRAELTAQLDEVMADLKKLKEERSLPTKVTDRLSEMEKLCPFLPFLEERSKKQRAALWEAYSNRELHIFDLLFNSNRELPILDLRLNPQEDRCCTELPIVDLRLNSQEDPDPCCTAASPPG